jgi:hypothetical protein
MDQRTIKMKRISPATYLATAAAIAELSHGINSVRTQHLPKNIKIAAEYLKEALAQFKEDELAARVIKKPMVGKVLTVQELTKLVTKLSRRIWNVATATPVTFAKSRGLELSEIFPCENATGLTVKRSVCKVVTFESSTSDRNAIFYMQFLLMPGHVTMEWATDRVCGDMEMCSNAQLPKALKPHLVP